MMMMIGKSAAVRPPSSRQARTVHLFSPVALDRTKAPKLDRSKSFPKKIWKLFLRKSIKIFDILFDFVD